MGKFIYDGNQKVEIEDRALHHLQVVITTKLRRGEPFLFTWREDVSVGGGRSSVWISAVSDLVFKYSSPGQADLNRPLDRSPHVHRELAHRVYVVHEPDGATKVEPGQPAHAYS
ncbi:ATP-dependent DNA ligase [Microbacterium sp. NPDC088619]|uniref:DUF7882 family protein n=1 Tax=Microbacterium sp. NPDC088619 TaxID=3364196 RepID=UPI0038265DDF